MPQAQPRQKRKYSSLIGGTHLGPTRSPHLTGSRRHLTSTTNQRFHQGLLRPQLVIIPFQVVSLIIVLVDYGLFLVSLFLRYCLSLDIVVLLVVGMVNQPRVAPCASKVTCRNHQDGTLVRRNVPGEVSANVSRSKKSKRSASKRS